MNNFQINLFARNQPPSERRTKPGKKKKTKYSDQEIPEAEEVIFEPSFKDFDEQDSFDLE